MGNLRDSLLALVEAGVLDLRDVPVHLRRASEVVNVRYNGRRKRGKKNANYTSKTYTLRGEVFNFDVVPKNDKGLLVRDERAVLVGPGGLAPKVRSANRVWEQCATYGVQTYKAARFPVRGFYNSREEAGGQGRAIVGVL